MNERRATFNPTSFAEGRFRRAYQGTWTAPPSDAGSLCVVKECKETYYWKPTDWDVTVKITEKAKEIASAFNAQVVTSRPITYTNVHVMKVIERSDPYKVPKLNEYVTCEDFIPGNFQKWCNNYGYIDDKSTSLPAFMHWSWWHTDSEMTVADLQGVRKDKSYLLTDPAIMSLSPGGYGATDTGPEGICMFFLKHKCNTFCAYLPKPTIDRFQGILPDDVLESAKAMVENNHGSTTYPHELKFPPHTRDRVAAKLREIVKESPY